MYEEGGGTGQTHAPAGYTRRKEPVGLIFLSRFWTLRPTRENLFESRLLLHHIVCFGTRVSFAFSLVSQAGSQCITTSIEGAVAGVNGLSCPSPDFNHISGSHFLRKPYHLIDDDTQRDEAPLLQCDAEHSHRGKVRRMPRTTTRRGVCIEPTSEQPLIYITWPSSCALLQDQRCRNQNAILVG